MKFIFFKAFRMRKIKIFILTLSLLIVIINIICLFKNYNNKGINNEIINKLQNRIVYVNSNNYQIDDLTKIDNVEKVYYNYDSILAYNNKNEMVHLKPLTFLININILYGKNKKYQEKELIFPNSFFGENINDCKKRLNEKVTLKLNDEEIEVAVGGIYLDEKKDGYIYIPQNSYLNKLINTESKYIIIINDKSNYENVIKVLDKKKIEIENDNDIGSETYQYMNSLLIIFYILCNIFMIGLLIILLLIKIVENRFYISLLKSLGCGNLKISIIFIFNLLIIFLAAYIFAIITIIGINIFMNRFLNIYNFFNINIIIKNCIIYVLILMFLIVINMLIMSKISIIKLLKNK